MNCKDYLSTSAIYLTAEGGEKCQLQPNVTFEVGVATGNVIEILPDVHKQTLHGIGTSFTESAAFVLSHLELEKRETVMRQIFSNEGANFPIGRTHVGSCDFCVKGHYSYADSPEEDLNGFSIMFDEDGFDQADYAGIKDESYDLLPMILQANNIKAMQGDEAVNLVASAWTAPPWMKDIESWHIKPSDNNDFQGTGGMLKPEHENTYARYLIKYIQAYEEKGVKIWGLTPVNEPLGNSGQWESMHFTPESQNDFIKTHLGPALHSHGYDEIKLYMFDHARDKVQDWARVLYSDAETAQYLTGAAVHWYESSFKVYEEELESVHQQYPGFEIIHTEGCIDDLGNDAPEGVEDPVGYKESGWFENDSFWWNDSASDWAYSVTWEGVNAANHPMYTPVHRYARNIIVSINHWLTGWIDWNIVLDKRGGPNHVGNYCGAPIMVDTDTQQVYYTPVFHVLKQFSKTIRPGDVALQVNQHLETHLKAVLYGCASMSHKGLLSVQLLNTAKYPISYKLQIGGQFVVVEHEANALKTLCVQLNN